MQLTRCPVCHSRIGLEQLVQDESGKELLGLVVRMPDWLSAPIVSYLGLFRSATRDLANDRAVRLTREVMALHDNQAALAQALTETVQAMRTKQERGGFKPLSNHNYLKSVLVSVSSSDLPPSDSNSIQTGVNNEIRSPKSKTAQAMIALREEGE